MIFQIIIICLLQLCGNFGTYSDACSAIILTHVDEIAYLFYKHMKAGPVCSLAGVCTEKFHSYALFPAAVGYLNIFCFCI